MPPKKDDPPAPAVVSLVLVFEHAVCGLFTFVACGVCVRRNGDSDKNCRPLLMKTPNWAQ